MRAALLSLLVLAAGLRAADVDKEYYPIQVGTHWTYKLGTQEDRLVIAAVRTEKVGEQECVVFEAKLKGQLVGTEYNAILKDGVYRFKYDAKLIEPAICFLKASAKKGDLWRHDFKFGDKQSIGKYEIGVEDVKVPAGEFKDALLVRVEQIEVEAASKSTVWYAKNVGMVKQVVFIEDTRIVLELEKMEGPKK